MPGACWERIGAHQPSDAAVACLGIWRYIDVHTAQSTDQMGGLPGKASVWVCLSPGKCMHQVTLCLWSNQDPGASWIMSLCSGVLGFEPGILGLLGLEPCLLYILGLCAFSRGAFPMAREVFSQPVFSGLEVNKYIPKVNGSTGSLCFASRKPVNRK